MELDFDTFTILLMLAPFAAAALAPLVSRQTGPAAGWILAIVPAGLFAALFGMIDEVAAGAPQRFAINWVPALGLNLSISIDGLALTFALMITGIGAIIVLYSATYLGDHPRRGTFLATMFVFMGAMLGVVLSDSLVALFCFWELTSVTSFLLIGFDRERMEARRAALQALIVTGAGGLALLAGGILLYLAGGNWDLHTLPAIASPLHFDPAYPWILVLILVAAFTKSAQLPFHFWLPNAMQAPTPVSAYLHSATMVQAGIYLLARMSPVLGGTAMWTLLLTLFGGATLLWGALMALSQTDLKQMLAQTTIASLGLMVLLLGLGGESAAMAVAAYFVAHALYKAALFLVAGLIEHGTGTRDLTRLGGFRDEMTITFIITALAALSMFGLPPFLGWFAKEEIFAATSAGPWAQTAQLLVLVIGNGLLAVIALAFLIRPFFGAQPPTPQTPRDGPFAMWLGPAVLGLLGFSVVFSVASVGQLLLAPMASSILGEPVESHLALSVDIAGLPFWLSIGTWALAAVIYLRLDAIRALLLAAQRRLNWSLDKGFDGAYFGLVRLAGAVTRALHHGQLELYIGLFFVALALTLILPFALTNDWPAVPGWPQLTFYEWGAVAIAVVGVLTVLGAPARLFAVLALGVQGLAVALLYLLFGAPDLGFTQLMVETVSVVIIALVLTRLDVGVADVRPAGERLRDGFLALCCGMGVTLLLLKVLETKFDSTLSSFFAQNSVPVAHGRNIVNVILVDFRGLDTLGEISVVMTAGIAILALLRKQRSRAPLPSAPPKRPRKKAEAT
ncbi:MAG: hydrogen gas-evolving membrane-bound hydrogenase subunit E [Devosia sp.]